MYQDRRENVVIVAIARVEAVIVADTAADMAAVTVDKAAEIAAVTTAADLPGKAVEIAAATIAADLPGKAADKAAETATEDLRMLPVKDNLHRKEAAINDIPKKSKVPQTTKRPYERQSNPRQQDNLW